MSSQENTDDFGKTDDTAWCAWCGQWGERDYMYLKSGHADWYHAECVKESTKSDTGYLFGESK